MADGAPPASPPGAYSPPPGGAASVDGRFKPPSEGWQSYYDSAPVSASRQSVGRRLSARQYDMPDFAERPVAAPAAPQSTPDPAPGPGSDEEPEPSVESASLAPEARAPPSRAPCATPGGPPGADADPTGLLEHLEQRVREVDADTARAAAQKDYARAWRLQEEASRHRRLQALVQKYSAEIGRAVQTQRAAAVREDYIAADECRARADHLRQECQEEVQAEQDLTRLELQLLDYAGDSDPASQAASAAIRGEIAELQRQRDARLQRRARAADLRLQARAKALAGDYAAAAGLQQEAAALDGGGDPAPAADAAAEAPHGYGHATLPGHDKNALANGPLYTPMERSPNPPAGNGRRRQPPPAATGAGRAGAAPRRDIGGTPAAAQPAAEWAEPGAAGWGAAAPPGVAGADPSAPDVVAQLADLIWKSTREPPRMSAHGAPDSALMPPSAAAPAPGRGTAGDIDPALRRRLMSFYQHYNPSKLPSVARCLREYRGNESRLFDALVRKYGPEPPDSLSTPLPPGWRLVEGANGDCFYLHEDGGKQWERPVNTAAMASLATGV